MVRPPRGYWVRGHRGGLCDLHWFVPGACFVQRSRYRGYVYDILSTGEYVMKKPDVVRGTGNDAAAFPDTQFRSEYPLICEYLESSTYDDGSKRAPSALSLFHEDGSCKVALNDKDLARSLYTSARSFQDALRLLEEALGRGDAPWRLWKRPGRK